MSAPLVLNATDLRALADGLDALSKARREHGVSPGHYDLGVTLRTESDEVTLRVAWEEIDGLEQFVIDDRYGS